MTTGSTETRPGHACARCTAAGVPRRHERTLSPYWDRDYWICPACLAAVEALLEATDTWPRLAEDGTPQFAAHPAHTDAPHFLWRPNIGGLSAQLAPAPPAPPAPTQPSLRGDERRARELREPSTGGIT